MVELSRPGIGIRVLVKHVPSTLHPGIALLSEFCRHLLGKSGLGCLVLRRGSQIVDAVGVGLQVVEFFGRSSAKAEIPKGLMGATSALVEDFCFDRTRITVEVAGLRIACRPA